MRVARVRRRSNGGSAGLVRVAPAITCCGKVGGISSWGSLAEGGVWHITVEVGDPARQHGSGVVEAQEKGQR